MWAIRECRPKNPIPLRLRWRDAVFTDVINKENARLLVPFLVPDTGAPYRHIVHQQRISFVIYILDTGIIVGITQTLHTLWSPAPIQYIFKLVQPKDRYQIEKEFFYLSHAIIIISSRIRNAVKLKNKPPSRGIWHSPQVARSTAF